MLLYAAGLVVTFDTWVRVYEEPRMRVRFGDDYERYLRRVPRWIGPHRAEHGRAGSDLPRPLPLARRRRLTSRYSGGGEADAVRAAGSGPRRRTYTAGRSQDAVDGKDVDLENAALTTETSPVSSGGAIRPPGINDTIASEPTR